MRPSRSLAPLIGPMLFACLFAVSAQGSAASDDFDAGLQAFRTGDTNGALQIWKRLANQGNSTAQYNLGVVYERGKGVGANIPQAMIWYRKAAENGRPDAQNNLGVLYAEGRGIPRDLEKAYIWLTLSMAQGYRPAVANRQLVEVQLSEAQRAAVKKRLWTYYANYVEPFQGKDTAAAVLPTTP